MLHFHFLSTFRPPPSSTLFPYTTLFRSPLGSRRGRRRRSTAAPGGVLPGHRAGRQARLLLRERSEEHTSELQSRGHLVCRLLLEKKKIKKVGRLYQRNTIKRASHDRQTI